MLKWGVIRPRSESHPVKVKASNHAKASDAFQYMRKPHEPKTAGKAVLSRHNNLDTMQMFRAHSLQAIGTMYFKVSKLQRSRGQYAELRGDTVVVFRHATRVRSDEARASDVMSVLPLLLYDVTVVDDDGDGTTKVFFTSRESADALVMYVVARGGANRQAWRHAAWRRRVPKGVPGLCSLRIRSAIGRGGSGRVFMAQSEGDGRLYALKVIDKSGILCSTKAFRHMMSERSLMEKLGRHPFILPLEFAFQTERHLFLGTPFCPGGDLAAYIRRYGRRTRETSRKSRRGGRRLPEKQSRGIMAEVLLGLEFLHSHGIVYRDLKPENVLIDTSGHMRIGDYGLAKHLIDDEGQATRTTSVCGTRNYLAPEMLCSGSYGMEVDVWSFGVMLYRLLVGRFPFDGTSTRNIFEAIKTHELSVPHWVSAEARDLLGQLLRKRAGRRASWGAIRQHAFFGGIDWSRLRGGRGVACVDLPAAAALSGGGDLVVGLVDKFDATRLGAMSVGDFAVAASDESAGGGGGAKAAGAALRVAGGRAPHRHEPRDVVAGFEFARDARPVAVAMPRAVTSRGGGGGARRSSRHRRRRSSMATGSGAGAAAAAALRKLPLAPRAPFSGGCGGVGSGGGNGGGLGLRVRAGLR